MNIIQKITNPMPTNLSYIVLTKLPLLSLLLHLLQNYCYHCYRYYWCCSYYQNYHTTLLLITLLQIINLQVWSNWQLSCEYLQIFFGSPCVESINLGWILYPRKLLRSPTLVSYHASIHPFTDGSHGLLAGGPPATESLSPASSISLF